VSIAEEILFPFKGAASYTTLKGGELLDSRVRSISRTFNDKTWAALENWRRIYGYWDKKALVRAIMHPEMWSE